MIVVRASEDGRVLIYFGRLGLPTTMEALIKLAASKGKARAGPSRNLR